MNACETYMQVSSTPALIPDHALAPEAWANEALRRSFDYSGMDEAAWFLTEARRYLSLAERIKNLQRQLEAASEPQ